jgi:hypothetical protein
MLEGILGVSVHIPEANKARLRESLAQQTAARLLSQIKTHMGSAGAGGRPRPV